MAFPSLSLINEFGQILEHSWCDCRLSGAQDVAVDRNKMALAFCLLTTASTTHPKTDLRLPGSSTGAHKHILEKVMQVRLALGAILCSCLMRKYKRKIQETEC